MVARWAHNPKVIGSNPFPATKKEGSSNKSGPPSLYKILLRDLLSVLVCCGKNGAVVVDGERVV